MNIAEWLYASGKTSPDAPALLTGDRLDADYAEFARRAAAIGKGLRDRLRVAPGDRVGLFMKNRTEYLEALYGIWWIGAVAVPINAKLHPKEAVWILQNAAAQVVFTSSEVGDALVQTETNLPADIQIISVDASIFNVLRTGETSGSIKRPQSRAGDDLAWLFYTSGTTGRPKGVMLSHGNLIAMSLCYPVDVDTVSRQDAALYAAPLSHGAGLYNFIHVRMGARHVVPLTGGFDCDEILDLATRLKNVSMFAAPTMVRRLVDVSAKRDAPGEGLKTVVYGGGPMYLADIEEAVATLGSRFVQIYGQGESPMTITALSRERVADRSHPRWRQRLASVGTAQACMEVRVIGSDDEELPPGEPGEVVTKGPAVMLGYWRNEEATAGALRDGWLRTGDIGSMDEDGFLTLSDRSKDVIISGGTNIYPREVEEALLSHPDVHEVAVVSRPHSDWGEEIVAFVVMRDGATMDPATLDRHCLNSIARFKRPKAYFEEQALPKNNYGKVLKTVLREKLAAITKGTSVD